MQAPLVPPRGTGRHAMCTAVLCRQRAGSMPEGLFHPLLQFRGSSGACSYRSNKTWVFPPPAHHKSLGTRPPGSSCRAEATASWRCCAGAATTGRDRGHGAEPPRALRDGARRVRAATRRIPKPLQGYVALRGPTDPSAGRAARAEAGQLPPARWPHAVRRAKLVPTDGAQVLLRTLQQNPSSANLHLHP